MCGSIGMTAVTTLWPHPIRPWTWNQTSRMNRVSTRIGGLTVGDHPTTVLTLRTQLRECEKRCAELRHEVEEWRDILDAREFELKEEIGRLHAELDNRRDDSWRPHR